MSNSELILSIRNLTVKYRSRRGYVNALRNINLDIYRNEALGIVGESGSGKTTLALAIIRQLPNNARIVSGSIIFYDDGNKVDLLTMNYDEFRRYLWEKIAFVPQGAMNSLNPVLKIKDHFTETVKAHNPDASKEEIVRKAREVLKVTLLDPDRVLNSYPHQLSGGMKQRVMISLALILNPAIIIMDEPTSSLDVVSQKIILQNLKDIMRMFNVTIIVITHDIGVVAEVANRVVVMYAGKIMEVGDVESVFYNALHPYTQGLLKAVPKLRGEAELYSIPGEPPDLVNPPSGCSFHPRCPFAMDICTINEPSLKEVNRGHLVACFKYETR